METGRRRILQAMAVLAGAAVAPGSWRDARAAGQPLPADPFRLGVASGFPTEHSTVLWTRLAPDPALPGGGLPALDWPVDYELATDERFRRIAARGTAIASAQFAHSVHAEVAGLSPDREYFYRFMAGGHRSAVGRTRTLPAARSRVAGLRLAVACCQHYEQGYFSAYHHLASEAPDLVVHVGDYIYEGAATTNRARRHSSGNCRTLDDYRLRYAQYKSDAALQTAHAVAPWLLTWDDHEVANDYSGADSGRAEDPAVFLAQIGRAHV